VEGGLPPFREDGAGGHPVKTVVVGADGLKLLRFAIPAADQCRHQQQVKLLELGLREIVRLAGGGEGFAAGIVDGHQHCRHVQAGETREHRLEQLDVLIAQGLDHDAGRNPAGQFDILHL